MAESITKCALYRYPHNLQNHPFFNNKLPHSSIPTSNSPSLTQISLMNCNFIIFMNFSQIASVLAGVNLHLEEDIIHQICAFQEHIPFCEEIDTSNSLFVLALAALVGQVKRIASVNLTSYVKSGITIELFLQHVKEESRQEYLSILGKILCRWTAPNWLRGKIVEVERRYRLFLSFRKVFRELGKGIGMEDETSSFLAAIFWIQYINQKYNSINYHKLEDQEVERRILGGLASYYFHLILAIKKEQVQAKVGEEMGVEYSASLSQLEGFGEECKRNMDTVIKKKFMLDNRVDIHYLHLQNIQFLNCFVNELSINFQKTYSTLPRFNSNSQINQIRFLDINKNITPIRLSAFTQTQLKINKRLMFEENDSDIFSSQLNSQESMEEKHLPTPSSHTHQQCARQRQEQKEVGDIKYEIFRYFYGSSPDWGLKKRREKFINKSQDSRVYALNWISEEIKAIRDVQNFQEKLTAFAMVSALDEQFYSNSIVKVVGILKKFCPKWKNIHLRSENIYKLFLSFLLKMQLNLPKDDFQSLISSKQNLNSLLCLSMIIFNYTYKAKQIVFSDYCSQFNISTIQAFSPLNWLGLKGSLLKELKQLLYQLQERILFDYIWKNRQLLEIFNEKQQCSYVEMVVKRRFFTHLQNRVEDICKNEMIEKDKFAVTKFVEDILTKRIQLLHGSNIYTLIVCSFLYCNKSLCIAKLLQYFKKSDMIISIYFQSRNYSGNQLPLDQYYQKIFLPQISTLCIPRKIIPSIKQTPLTQARLSIEQDSHSLSLRKIRFGEDNLPFSRIGELRKSLAMKIREVAQKLLIEPQSSNSASKP